MRRLAPVLVLSAALLAGCADPYGRVDYGRTALLGLGVGAAAALTAGALADKPRPYYGNRRGNYGGGYGYGAPSRDYRYSAYGYEPRGRYHGGW